MKSQYFKNDINSNSLSNDIVWDIRKDQHGYLWLATSDGLNRYDPYLENFTVFRIPDGLPNNFISAILEDDIRNLWVSTKKGLSQIQFASKDHVNFQNYGIKDGLQISRFTIRSAIKDNLGDLYFSGKNGRTAGLN